MNHRYRIVLQSAQEGALVLRPPDRQTSRQAAASFVTTLSRLGRRGPGPSGWAPVFEHPLSFLLDGMSDGVVVRNADGRVLFANPLAQRLQMEQRGYSRCEEFQRNGETFQVRSLDFEEPEGQLTLTLVTRV